MGGLRFKPDRAGPEVAPGFVLVVGVPVGILVKADLPFHLGDQVAIDQFPYPRDLGGVPPGGQDLVPLLDRAPDEGFPEVLNGFP